MNRNSEIIIALCSRLRAEEAVDPLTTKEWGDLAAVLMKKDKEPVDLGEMSVESMQETLGLSIEYAKRIESLLGRSASLAFVLSEYLNIGIGVVTRADGKDYPDLLRQKLKNNMPPLFYYAGNLDLLNRNYIGYVGSRDIEEPEIDFIKKTVAKTVSYGYGVVSGGARGADQVSERAALDNNGFVIEFVSDSLLKKLKDKDVLKAVRAGKLLLMSESVPKSGFITGMAMSRNKYIYAQSEGTVVVKSGLNKGGTWEGAIENLKNNWAKTLCWNNKAHIGNLELIKKGAIPIDESWNGNIEDIPEEKPGLMAMEDSFEQIALPLEAGK